MYLKRLELKGFKSFADKSVLTLLPGISAVVGPNGSGKSNICDAILWVLGERNAKSLRGSVMEDVIFAGSSERKAVSVAEVTLVLDNSDGVLPLEFSEVSLTRRLYRSGESEYLINDVPSRRLDVLDILHDSGLGTDTNSIISQGNLDSILQSKPIDRRALIEEAAGVLKHKQRKIRSEHKIDRMDQNMARIGDVMAEIERQLKPLRIKAKRAAAYDGLCAELSELTLQLAVDDLKKVKIQWDKINEQEKELTITVGKNRQEYDNAQAALDKMRQKIASQSSEIMAHSQRQRRLNSVIEKLQGFMLLLEEKANNAQRVLDNFQAKTKSGQVSEAKQAILDEIDKTSFNIKTLNNEIAKLKEQLQESSDKLKAKQEVFQKNQEDHDKAVGSSQNHQKESDDIRKKLSDAQDSIIEAQSKTRSVEDKINELSQRQDTLSKSLKEDKTVLDAKQKELEVASKSEQKLSDDLEKLFSELSESQDKKNELTEQYIEVSSQISATEKIIDSLHEQESQAIKWLDKNKDQFGANSISDLIEIDDEYISIVESILGAHSASYIIDNQIDNISSSLANNEDCDGSLMIIEKRNNSFIQQLANDAQQASNDFGGKTLSSIVSFSETNDDLSALANVVVFEKSDKVFECCKKYPSVTAASLDGTVVFSDGRAIIGKLDSSKTQVNSAKSLILNKKNLKKQTSKLKHIDKDINKLNEKINKLDVDIETSREKHLEMQTKVAKLQVEFDSASTNYSNNSDRLEQVSSQLESAKNEQKLLKEAYGSTGPEIERLNKRLEELGGLIEKDRETIEAKAKTLEKSRQNYYEFNAKHSEINNQLIALNERNDAQQEMLDGANKRLKVIEIEETSNLEELEVNKVIIDRANQLGAIISSLEDCAKKDLAKLDLQSNEVNTAAKKFQEMSDKAISEANNARKVYEQSAEKLNSVKVEIGRLDVKVQNALDAIDEQENISVETALQMPDLEDREDKEQRAFRIRRRIANMGTINPDAQAEYNELKERFDFLNEQLDDLKSARVSLQKITKIIDMRMKDDFINTFHVVNENFQSIFEVLFPGGHARLELDQPDDIQNSGVEVKAQPKGKKISRMSLMSGGEKSLVALCLLFAVYKTRSTPFYILDEVEAALDDTNLRRLIKYLEDLCKETQLIMITHQRRTMEMADVLYGVSMKANGITKVVSQKLDKKSDGKKISSEEF